MSKKRVNLYLEAELAKRLKVLAANSETSMSAIVEELLNVAFVEK